MKKPIDKKMIEAHEADVKEFDSRTEQPAAYICFVWPDLNRWQAIVAYEAHREGIPAAKELLRQGRMSRGDGPPTLRQMGGDALNVLAELTLTGATAAAFMGSMVLFASETMEHKYMVAIVNRSMLRGKEVGSTVDVEPMTGVDSVAQARDFMNRHPLVVAAQKALMLDLLKGPQH